MFSQEQRIAAAGTGVLHCGAITHRDGAVFQNQLYGNALASLADRGKARGNRRTGINEPVMTCAIFDRLLVIKIE